MVKILICSFFLIGNQNIQMGFVSSSVWIMPHRTIFHTGEKLRLIKVGEKNNKETNFVLWKTKSKPVPFKVVVEMGDEGVTSYKEPLARSKRCWISGAQPAQAQFRCGTAEAEGHLVVSHSAKAWPWCSLWGLSSSVRHINGFTQSRCECLCRLCSRRGRDLLQWWESAI